MFSFFRKNKVKSINVNDLYSLLGKINLIDIRENYEYKNGHIKGAKNIPMEELLDESEKYLDDFKEYHIICHSGGRSLRTAKVLKKKGFNVVNVLGGTRGYRGSLKK